LRLHGVGEACEVDTDTTRAQGVLRQVEREAVGVFEREGIRAGDDRAFGTLHLIDHDIDLAPFAARYGFEAKIDAQTGRDIEAGLSPLEKIMSGRDLVVVALGTNDARAGLTATEADARIDEMMEKTRIADITMLAGIGAILGGLVFGYYSDQAGRRTRAAGRSSGNRLGLQGSVSAAKAAGTKAWRRTSR